MTSGITFPRPARCARFVAALGLCLVACLDCPPAVGQPSSQTPVSERLRTELQFDILFPRERPNGLAAQEWAEVFSRLNVPLRIRQPGHNDKPGAEQQVFGTIRRVTVIGQLDRSGMLVFPDREFRQSDVDKLAEWIEELQVYGAQGAPDGQPLWGLKQVEFDRLHAQMKVPVAAATKDLSLTDCLRAFDLPDDYPLRFSAATRELLVAHEPLPLVPHDYQGMAKGTALAMLLRGYGLAYLPRRLPDESITISVEPIDETGYFWPTGWDPDQLGMKRLAVADKMFTALPIEISQTTFTELMPRIESETGLPVLIDPHAITVLGLNLDRLVVNYPRKRTSWSLCLRAILAQVKLTQEVRVDENDRPFIWITRFTPRAARD